MFAAILKKFERAERAFPKDAFDIYTIADPNQDTRFNIKAHLMLTMERRAYAELPRARVEIAECPPLYLQFRVYCRHGSAFGRYEELSKLAGEALPEKIIHRLGLVTPCDPRSAWTWFLIDTLKNDENKLAQLVWETTYGLHNAIYGSILAIELAGLMTANESAKSAYKSKKNAAKQRIVDAALMVADKPDLSDREIAATVGVNPSTLSRSKLYQKAALEARNLGYKRYGGIKTKEGKFDAKDDD